MENQNTKKYSFIPTPEEFEKGQNIDVTTISDSIMEEIGKVLNKGLDEGMVRTDCLSKRTIKKVETMVQTILESLRWEVEFDTQVNKGDEDTYFYFFLQPFCEEKKEIDASMNIPQKRKTISDSIDSPKKKKKTEN